MEPSYAHVASTDYSTDEKKGQGAAEALSLFGSDAPQSEPPPPPGYYE